MTNQLLQVFPPIFKDIKGRPAIDLDWSDAINVYLQNFDRVVFAGAISPDDLSFALNKCVPIEEFGWGDRFEFVPLPYAYKIKDFIKHYSAVRGQLRHLISESDYVELSPHALIGDWAGLACLEAIRQKKPYIVSGDVVYHKVAKLNAAQKPLFKRLIKRLTFLPLMQSYHHYLYRHSALAMFQGQDTYGTFAHLCPRSEQIYHVTVTEAEHITNTQLDAKLSTLSSPQPLKITYAGRAAEMKGALDWIRTLHQAIQHEVPIQATWLGDGLLLPQMKLLAKELGIAEHIDFAGFIGNRSQLLNKLSQTHIFMFCHKTPESPRCLIEALALGCPLVGYDSSYPRGLLAGQGGGKFVPQNDWSQLAQTLTSLHQNRHLLKQLIVEAAKIGKAYERDAAYQHRIDLIKSL